MAEESVDILVLGANPGGLCAAISAARAGHWVLVLEATSIVGGMTGNGVCGFDAARRAALSGIASEFEELISEYYAASDNAHDPVFDLRDDQVWEPAVARACWQKLIDDTANLNVRTGAVVVDAVTKDRRIVQVHWQPARDVFGSPSSGTPQVVAADLIIDASYEGDILEFAEVPHQIGREARSLREPHAGRILTSDRDWSSQGYMPHSVLPGSTGEADGTLPAFGMRVPCKWYEDTSASAAHRVSMLEGYDPTTFKWQPMDHDADGQPIWFKGNYLMVGDKFLLNRMVGGNQTAVASRAYIKAHPRDRSSYREAIMDVSRAYLHFIQNEGGTPQLGAADDDFPENDGIPYQVYVREGRRIDGHYCFTEADVNPFIDGDGSRPSPKSDAIAIGDWIFESHGSTDTIDEGYAYPEGWLFNRVTQCPYQVPYGTLVPHRVDNLLVCGSVSSTHVGFSALRCEAVRMQTGIAAGLAATLCIENQIVPANVNVETLQNRIVAQNGKIVYFGDIDDSHDSFAAIQWAGLHGFVPQSQDWLFEPDRSVTWSEAMRVAVTVLSLPISVTGAHFESIGRYHPDFRYAESLYDLGTRSDIDLFNARGWTDENPLLTMLRLHPEPRLIPLTTENMISCESAAILFTGIERAFFTDRSRDGAWPRRPATGALSRGDLAEILYAMGRRDDLIQHNALAHPSQTQ